MALVGIGSVKDISFTELLSVGLASLNGEAIRVCFSGSDYSEYNLLLKHLGEYGYRATDHVEHYSNGVPGTVVFVKETYASVRNEALENQISVLEKEFGVVICYKKK